MKLETKAGSNSIFMILISLCPERTESTSEIS